MHLKIRFTRSNLFKLLMAVLALAATGLLQPQISVFFAWVGDRHAISQTMQQFGIWGPFVLFVLLVLQVFVAVIPGHALILAGSYVFGFVPGMLITLFSTVLGGQIAFVIARRFGRGLIDHLAPPQVIERWDRAAANQGAVFYIFAFVLPIFPSDLMCYVAGLGRISFSRFLAANISGRLVTAVFITLIGANGLRMPWQFWAAAILGMAGFYAGYFFYSRKGGRGKLLLAQPEKILIKFCDQKANLP